GGRAAAPTCPPPDPAGPNSRTSSRVPHAAVGLRLEAGYGEPKESRCHTEHRGRPTAALALLPLPARALRPLEPSRPATASSTKRARPGFRGRVKLPSLNGLQHRGPALDWSLSGAGVE